MGDEAQEENRKVANESRMKETSLPLHPDKCSWTTTPGQQVQSRRFHGVPPKFNLKLNLAVCPGETPAPSI